MTASRWFYYSVPADTDSFEITVSSDLGLSVYVRKGNTELPDPVNFDAVVKNQTSITVPSSMLPSEVGWMLAVHVQGNSSDVTTNFSIKINEYTGRSALDTIDFLDLAAAATPASPMPLPPSGKKDAFFDQNDDISTISNLQFVLLGALLGCLATVLFYQIARFAAQYRLSRAEKSSIVQSADSDSECPKSSDPNRHLKKNFKEPTFSDDD